MNTTDNPETIPVSTQKGMVLEHLRRFGSIEPLTALRDYGCYRLAAIINTLRGEGVAITTLRVDGISRITGRHIRFARYVLQPKHLTAPHAL